MCPSGRRSELRRLAAPARASRPPRRAVARSRPAAIGRHAVVTQLIRSEPVRPVPVRLSDATSGTPSPLPHRARMESAFGQSFAGSLTTMGARRPSAASARLGTRRGSEPQRRRVDDEHRRVELAMRGARWRARRSSEAPRRSLPRRPNERPSRGGRSRRSSRWSRSAPRTAPPARTRKTRGEYYNWLRPPHGSKLTDWRRDSTTRTSTRACPRSTAGGSRSSSGRGSSTDRVPRLTRARDRASARTDTTRVDLSAERLRRLLPATAPGASFHYLRPVDDPAASPCCYDTVVGDESRIVGRHRAAAASCRRRSTGAAASSGRGQTFEINFEETRYRSGDGDNYFGSVEGAGIPTRRNVTLKPLVPLASGAPGRLHAGGGVWTTATLHDRRREVDRGNDGRSQSRRCSKGVRAASTCARRTSHADQWCKASWRDCGGSCVAARVFEALMPALFGREVPEETWAPQSWGANHPLTVQAQIHHGMKRGRLLLGLLAGFEVNEHDREQARGRLRRLGRGRRRHGSQRGNDPRTTTRTTASTVASPAARDRARSRRARRALGVQNGSSRRTPRSSPCATRR